MEPPVSEPSAKYTCPAATAAAEPPLRISGDAARYDHREGNDDYTQAGDLFRLMDPAAQQRLFGNIARSMNGVPQEIVMRQLCHFFRADPAYGMGVAQALRIPKETLLPFLPAH